MTDPVSPRNAHINAALSNFASAYQNSQYLADEVSPVFLVDKESDSFHKRLRIDEATILDDAAGPRAQLKEATYDLDEDSYSVRPRGLRQAVPESLVLNADASLSPEQLAVANVMNKIKLARENRVATQIMTAGNWASGNTAAVSNAWSDEASGTPLADLQTGLQAIPFNGDDVRVIGVCSDLVWHALSRHPQLMSLRAGGGSAGGPLSTAELAGFLEVDSILVSKIHKNTANLGATASYSRIWGTSTFAWVVVPTELMSTEQTIFSCTFRHNLPGSVKGIRVREWHDPSAGVGGCDFKACELKDAEKVIQNDAGYLFTSVL